MLWLQVRIWVIAGVVLLVGLIFVLVVWTILASTFLVDRAWWAWNGWPAIAGLAQIAAVIVTLGTLIFLAIQVVMLRGQMRQEATRRRPDFERSLSPLVSIQILRKSTTLEARTLRIACQINADGAGVVYNLVVTLREVPPSNRRPVIARPCDTSGRLINISSGCLATRSGTSGC